MNIKKIISTALSLIIALSAAGAALPETDAPLNISVSAAYYTPKNCSEEFSGTGFYSRLETALEESGQSTVMERALAVALSQDGYKNYALDEVDINRARDEGKLWTGAIQRDDYNETGNTEYTRWIQSYVLGSSAIYSDIDWCAIFMSWCLYQSGYYSGDELKRFYYSYCADPRLESSYYSWIESFNLDQHYVWYTPLAYKKLDAYSGWNEYFNTNIDPYDLPYKPGGLLFFGWDGDGRYFDHVGMVISFDRESHILKYISGNDDGQVRIREYDFEDTTYKKKPKIKNYNRILAYAEYDSIENLIPKTIEISQTAFECERNNNDGITIETNSESKTVLIKQNGNMIASHLNETATISSGSIFIAEEVINSLNDGENTLNVVLEDNAFAITVTVNEPVKKVLKAEKSELEWDRASASGLTIKTNSSSDLIDILRGDERLATINTEGLTITNGEVSVTAEVLNNILNDGLNELVLLLTDGTIDITINVTNELRIISADNTYFQYEQFSEDDIQINTNSYSDTVSLYMNGNLMAEDDGKLLYIKDSMVFIKHTLLDGILTDGENDIVLSFEDGILNIKVFMTKPPKEITLEHSEYKWEFNDRDGLRMRSNSDSYYVIVSCNGKDLSSYSDAGITLINGVITIEPDRLKDILAVGNNDMTFTFGDGETSAVINMTMPEKVITADHKEFSIRPSSENDTVIHTNSDSSEVIMNVNGRYLNSADTDGLSASNGTVVMGSSLLLSVLNQGENLVTFEFPDGKISIKASLFEDSYKPTLRDGTEQSSSDESSAESSADASKEDSQDSKESKADSKTESLSEKSASESLADGSSDAQGQDESAEETSGDESGDKTSQKKLTAPEQKNDAGVIIVVFLIVAAVGAAVTIFIFLNRKNKK